MEGVADWLWSESFWFPEGVGWKDLVPEKPDVYYPQLRDILPHSIAIGVLLLIFRHVFDRFVFIPFGNYIGGIKKKKVRHVEDIPALEQSFVRNKHCKDLQTLVKKTNLSERQIQRWFRNRRMRDVPSPMAKFCEEGYHFVFYTSSLLYGLYVLWDKPWFSKTKFCWEGWPNHHVNNQMYYYYAVELGYYWSLIFSLLSDTKRKDFKEMTIHHLATLGLMYLSWTMNFVRVGTLILFVHDMADNWMAGAKMANYSHRSNLCEALFGIFVVVWFVTRLGVYPYVCLYTLTFEIMEYVQPFQMHRVFVALSFLLQGLHLIWSYFVLRIIFQKFDGGVQKDSRSDSEEESTEFEDEIPEKKQKNGSTGLNGNNNENVKSRRTRKA